MARYYEHKKVKHYTFKLTERGMWFRQAKAGETHLWQTALPEQAQHMDELHAEGKLVQVTNPDHKAQDIRNCLWDHDKMKHCTEALLDYADLELRVAAAYREATSANHTNNEKKDMKTYTKVTLEQEINPVQPEVRVDVRDSVAVLEADNVNAAANIVKINTAQDQQGKIRLIVGYTEVPVTEKYSKRIARLLSDMRKDEEDILEETSAKLAKVAKVLS